MKPWSVLRTWWELTKLILRGCGGYDLYLRVDDLPDEAQDAFNRENWCPVRVNWTDSRDHFVTLSGEAEFGLRAGGAR